MWWLWGCAGAFVFGHGALIFALWNSDKTRAERYQAIAEFFAGLATGGIFAQGLTPTLQKVAAPWFTADSVAVALTVGWASNYLWPRLLRKLGERVDKVGSDKETKA